ncbi:hypothetical protein [Leucobacter luti]|uniref:PH-like domain-containing protein n=1 Tax=Leucobacter luti TaxID=340320 RepID=UPI003D06636F
MSRTAFTIFMISIAGIMLIAMLIAWRARGKRAAAMFGPQAGAEATPETAEEAGSEAPLGGEFVAEFRDVSYVSTTPAGAPLERVAIPGLTYKGFADVEVRRGGVTIAVTGETPVEIAAARVLGTATTNGRIGKAVERDGLSLLLWQADTPEGPRELESSFRLAEPAVQRRFAEAIASIAAAPHMNEPDTTTQEDA